MKGTPNAFQVETVRPKERERRRLLLQKSPLRQNIAGHLEILLHRFVGRLIVEHDERVLLPRQQDQPAVHAAGRQPVVQRRRLMLFLALDERHLRESGLFSLKSPKRFGSASLSPSR